MEEYGFALDYFNNGDYRKSALFADSALRSIKDNPEIYELYFKSVMNCFDIESHISLIIEYSKMHVDNYKNLNKINEYVFNDFLDSYRKLIMNYVNSQTNDFTKNEEVDSIRSIMRIYKDLYGEDTFLIDYNSYMDRINYKRKKKNSFSLSFKVVIPIVIIIIIFLLVVYL